MSISGIRTTVPYQKVKNFLRYRFNSLFVSAASTDCQQYHNQTMEITEDVLRELVAIEY